MIFIDNVLVSEEILSNKFVCNLNACKGACCWEGDYGAPLSDEEANEIKKYNHIISKRLSPEAQTLLESTEGFTYYEDAEQLGTSLHPDGKCVYLNFNEIGIAQCAIEQTHINGEIPVNKPISCHLYPIRVSKNENLGFEAWNYDEWDICSAACTLGEELKVPIYQFVKDAIIRYKGHDFYEGLDDIKQNISTK
jgi:Fe-S-cluster containining protein